MSLLSQTRSPKAEVPIYARLADHLAILRRMIVLEYTAGAATLVDGFRRQKLKVGAMDLKIAAITMAANAMLITRNISDFRKIPELLTQDWTRE